MKINATAPVSGAGETHHGGRETNQDVFIVDVDRGLFAVFDGMGGHAAGDIAAQMASDGLVAFIAKHASSGRFTPRELLEFAIDHAGVLVHRAGHQKTTWEGMGTTAIACLVVDSTRIILGNVGDSRAYRLRGGRLQRMTRDHTLAQNLVDDKVLTEEEADKSHYRNVLTRALGHELGVIADMLELATQPGDRILLCSDGLYGCVPQRDLERLLGSGTSAQAARALIEAALTSGAVSDNVTAVVLDVARERPF
jgi:protein phosphatase